ncbi:hypothetical protein [Sphingomonas sp. NIBR02145]|uniref:hypothetical protein n=1 Tax=Sphingomonas sp. NIBR02145 TaxID=3014784 RepID=UPI0022B483A9|nr:hypothetical protein [Sphingomonas sp. NIBR02145]WHU01424.1 hypothetical protein O3305_14595 [Sphingomonas sp. NIBR02145]
MKQLHVTPADQQAVLATLPNRFVIDAAGADVHTVRGDALPDAGNGAVMIVAPGLASAQALRSLAATGRPIGLALAAAAALPEAALDSIRAQADDIPLIVDAAAETVDPLRAALFELLMLLDTLGCHADGLRLLAITPNEIALVIDSADSWNGTRVSARRSFRTRYALETVSRTLRREIVINDIAVSTPAEVRLFDAAGTRTALPRYEGGLRASWRALHVRLTEGAGDGGQLETAIRLLGLLDTAGVA